MGGGDRQLRRRPRESRQISGLSTSSSRLATRTASCATTRISTCFARSAAGNGKLLFVVPNRGVPTYAPWLKGGFLLDRGWTIASCGWQWDVQRGPAILGLTAPKADVPPGFMRLEWRADAASDGHALSFSAPEVDSLPGAESLFTFTDYPTSTSTTPTLF